jgi:hypothetical protein
MTALPMKVASMNVQNGIRKCPQQMPHKSKARFGYDAMNITPKNPCRLRNRIIQALAALIQLNWEFRSNSSGISSFSPNLIAANLAARVIQYGGISPNAAPVAKRKQQG